MRTTVTIDDDLIQQAKQQATATHRTLGQVVEEALRDHFARRPANEGGFKLRLVTYGGSGTRPGVDITDNAAVRDVMDGLG